MIILYSIVFIVALICAITCCYFIARCAEDIDRSDAYKYDADDIMMMRDEDES